MELKQFENTSALDMSLSAEVSARLSYAIEKQGKALNPRGELYTSANIRARLNMRDFMDTMRASGVHHSGQAAYGNREKQAFANALDRYLAKSKQRPKS